MCDCIFTAHIELLWLFFKSTRKNTFQLDVLCSALCNDVMEYINGYCRQATMFTVEFEIRFD